MTSDSMLLVIAVFFPYFVVEPCFGSNTFKASDEQKLRSYLRPVRDSHVLPVLNKAEKAKFSINLTIPPDHIMDMTIDSSGSLWLDIILCMQWNSSALMWDPRDFNNVTYTAFYNELIWTPILEAYETIIPQSAFLSGQYWKFRMSVVAVAWNGYTEFCPQVHLPLACAIEKTYDAFPTEEFTCNTVIKDMSPMADLRGIIIEERTSVSSDWRSSFSGSGFEMMYLRTEQGKNSAIVRVKVRRESSQWLNLVTIPVFLMSFLCLISLWMSGQSAVRSLTFCSALVAVLLFQLQLYSKYLVHCSKPPVVLTLLGQLVIGQLVIAVLHVLEITLEASEGTKQTYARLEYIYFHSVAHKYVEWARVRFLDRPFEKFEDELDLNESQGNPDDKSAPMNLIAFCGIVTRIIISAVFVFYICKFSLLFL